MPKAVRATGALLALVTGASWSGATTLSPNLTEAPADTKAKLAAKEQADILILGDSLSFSYEVTTYLTYFRKYAQNKFGNAGYGYQAASVWTGSGFNQDWTGPSLSTDPAPHHGLDGLWQTYAPNVGGPNQAYLTPRSSTA